MDLATVFCYQRNSSKTKQHWNWEKNKEQGLQQKVQELERQQAAFKAEKDKAEHKKRLLENNNAA